MVISPVDLGFPYNLLNIPTNPHNMVIFPVGFPYNLQRAKFPYCRGIPLRVATLKFVMHVAGTGSGPLHRRHNNHNNGYCDHSLTMRRRGQFVTLGAEAPLGFI